MTEVQNCEIARVFYEIAALLDHVDLGITTARRAWIGPAQVLNTRSLDDLLARTRRSNS
jgi:hypothetical protein